MAKNNSRYLYKNGGYRLFNTILKYFKIYIVVVSFIGGGNQMEYQKKSTNLSLVTDTLVYHLKLYQVHVATSTGIKLTACSSDR